MIEWKKLILTYSEKDIKYILDLEKLCRQSHSQNIHYLFHHNRMYSCHLMYLVFKRAESVEALITKWISLPWTVYTAGLFAIYFRIIFINHSVSVVR